MDASLSPYLTELDTDELAGRFRTASPTRFFVADDFIEKLQRTIVGIELEVTRIEAKRKLSQNKPDGDVSGAIDGLRRRGDERSATIADRMEG